MRVLITGGSGLIGQALALDLANDGNEVIVLSRHPNNLGGLPDRITAAKWDALTSEGWYHLADGADALVNLAGESIGSGRWTAERKHEIIKSRLQSGRAIVEALDKVAHKPRVLVQASAVGYYGNSGDRQLTETSPRGSDFLAELSSEWEASTEPVERLGVRRAAVRTGVVLSCKGGALPKMLLPFKFFAGGRLGNGRQWFPWIHIHDEVKAIRFLIEKPTARGPFNLTAPYPLTNAEFSRLLGKHLKRPSSFPVPRFVLRMVFGEMASVLLEGQQAIPDGLLKEGFSFKFPEAGSAIQDLLS